VPQELAQAGIRAFHGSPYDFDKFDLSKIGTGEGAQTYGHGLYFADNPKVAESYKNDPSMISFAKGKDWSDEQEEAFKYLHENGYDQIKASADIANRISRARMYGDTPESTKSLQDVKSIIDSGWQPPRGHTYEVSINADPEHFLDWDKPLSEQSPHVKNVLQAGKWAAPTAEDTGEQFLRGLSPEDHSQLGKEGIPGIKYLDQGSRFNAANLPDNPITKEAKKYMEGASNADAALGSFKKDQAANSYKDWGRSERDQIESVIRNSFKPQTSNYVVFNDKLIDIVKKYGLAGLVAGGAAHFSTTPVDHDPFQ
jgi:hypothetical protein